MRSGFAGKKTHAVVSVYQNIGQTVFYHKVEQFFRWLCVRPSIFVTVRDVQSSFLCRFLEVFVVVGVATATILHAVDVVVIVNHFMKQSGNDVFDWSC